ncbi:MAG: adenylate/guanylate cyclase domain-containing protein [Chloroflexota bacterium]|nr:adenylate/guanylate cyclase domain-containing protein [Chloroflexota bacterium]
MSRKRTPRQLDSPLAAGVRRPLTGCSWSVYSAVGTAQNAGVVPETRYAKSLDGIHIAYQVIGDADLDLVLSPGFVSHVEHSWEDPSMARFLRRLASFTRLIVFDKRGTGLSDRAPDGQPGLLEDRVNDIAALMDAVGSKRAAIMGVSETGPVALLFAATHPERTRAVVAYGTFSGKGDTGPTYPWAPTPGNLEWLDHLERSWGRGALFLEDFVPSLVSDRRYVAWFAKLERLAASPGAAVALARMVQQIDVREILPTIRVPTLVLHRRDDQAVPLKEGQYIADHVPGAKFIALPGADHWPWIGDQRAVEEIQEFLTGMRDSAAPERVLATVMFVDIVDSTKRAAEIGDRRWVDLLESFYGVVRNELARYRGREIDTAGDGFFATFDGPAQAIRCAMGLIEAVERLELQVRVGIHTGEVERIADSVGGLAVVIGARVGALAGPGEILVSRTVTDLVVGSSMVFEQRGKHQLKGVPGEWELYAVDRDQTGIAALVM